MIRILDKGANIVRIMDKTGLYSYAQNLGIDKYQTSIRKEDRVAYIKKYIRSISPDELTNFVYINGSFYNPIKVAIMEGNYEFLELIPGTEFMEPMFDPNVVDTKQVYEVLFKSRYLVEHKLSNLLDLDLVTEYIIKPTLLELNLRDKNFIPCSDKLDLCFRLFYLMLIENPTKVMIETNTLGFYLLIAPLIKDKKLIIESYKKVSLPDFGLYSHLLSTCDGIKLHAFVSLVILKPLAKLILKSELVGALPEKYQLVNDKLVSHLESNDLVNTQLVEYTIKQLQKMRDN